MIVFRYEVKGVTECLFAKSLGRVTYPGQSSCLTTVTCSLPLVSSNTVLQGHMRLCVKLVHFEVRIWKGFLLNELYHVFFEALTLLSDMNDSFWHMINLGSPSFRCIVEACHLFFLAVRQESSHLERFGSFFFGLFLRFFNDYVTVFTFLFEIGLHPFQSFLLPL